MTSSITTIPFITLNKKGNKKGKFIHHLVIYNLFLNCLKYRFKEISLYCLVFI